MPALSNTWLRLSRTLPTLFESLPSKKWSGSPKGVEHKEMHAFARARRGTRRVCSVKQHRRVDRKLQLALQRPLVRCPRPARRR